MSPTPKHATTAPAEVARAIFVAINARDADAMVTLAAPDVHDDVVAVGEFHGHTEVRGFFVELFAAFPDFTMTVERIAADGPTVVVQWRAEGTFTGQPFLGIVATGRHVTIKGVDVMDIEDGLLQHNTVYYDGASLARQVGLLPKKDSLGDRAVVGGFNLLTRATGLVRQRLAR